MKLRSTQREVLQHITEAIAAGKRDIFVQAPTGTGKSLIALELSKTLSNNGYSSYLLTSEKSLQQQYEIDCQGKFAERHEDVISIAGIDTYLCNVNGEKFSLGVCRSLGMSYAEANKLPCASSCQYIQKWTAARFADRTIMNYAYYLIHMNYVLRKMGEKAPFSPRDVVICDEAHKIPDVVESHFACRLQPETADRINRVISNLKAIGYHYDVSTLPLYSSITEALKIGDDAPAAEHHEALQAVYRAYSNLLETLNGIKEHVSSKNNPSAYDTKQLAAWHSKLPKAVKQMYALVDTIKDHHCKIEDYVTMIAQHGLDNLVACTEDGERIYHNMSDFHLFHKHFKNFSKVRVYMSATLQPKLLIDRWRLDPNACHIINVSSTWDCSRSPIILCDVANMGYSGGDSATRRAIEKIDAILDNHRNERGVIHSVTNQLASDIKERSRHADRLYTYNGTSEKLNLLENIRDLPDDCVLVGPSLFTGIDLPDDLGRFNIIVKLAFPNVANGLWKRRFDYSKDVYFGETAAVLEQSAGRTTRHCDDYSTTYVIDSRAADFVKYSRCFLSDSFVDRLNVKPQEH